MRKAQVRRKCLPHSAWLRLALCEALIALPLTSDAVRLSNALFKCLRGGITPEQVAIQFLNNDTEMSREMQWLDLNR